MDAARTTSSSYPVAASGSRANFHSGSSASSSSNSGIAGALESIVKGLNIPILSANLGGGEEFSALNTTGRSAYEGIGAYVQAPGVAAYPMGDLGDGMGMELGM